MDAVHIEIVVQVADYLGFEIDGSLNLALGHTLHSLAYCTNNTDILTVETHPCYLDVVQGDPHLVDEVQVDEVVGAGGQVRGARHSEGDLPADEGIVCTALHLNTVGDNVEVLFFFDLHD